MGSLHRADGSVEARGVWALGRLHVGPVDPQGRPHGAGAEWGVASRYDGEFERGQRSGLGALTLLDGGAWEGQWAGGQRCGFGVEWDRLGCPLRVGRWADGRLAESCPVPRSQLPADSWIDSLGQCRRSGA